MTLLPDGIGGLLVRSIGKVLGGLLEATLIATVSTAQTLLEKLGSGLAKVLGRWNEAKLRKLEAEACTAEAEAMKRLAEAYEAANRTMLLNEEARLKRAAAAKIEAEAYAIRTDTEARKQTAATEAQMRLIDGTSGAKKQAADSVL